MASALDSGGDDPQFETVVSDGRFAVGQERPQVWLHHQVALDLKRQSPSLGVVRGRHEAMLATEPPPPAVLFCTPQSVGHSYGHALVSFDCAAGNSIGSEAESGGRSWWAHCEFTRINIAPPFVRNKIEELRLCARFVLSCRNAVSGSLNRVRLTKGCRLVFENDWLGSAASPGETSLRA